MNARIREALINLSCKPSVEPKTFAEELAYVTDSPPAAPPSGRNEGSSRICVTASGDLTAQRMIAEGHLAGYQRALVALRERRPALEQTLAAR
jgi:hypothetical protein